MLVSLANGLTEADTKTDASGTRICGRLVEFTSLDPAERKLRLASGCQFVVTIFLAKHKMTSVKGLTYLGAIKAEKGPKFFFAEMHHQLYDRSQ